MSMTHVAAVHPGAVRGGTFRESINTDRHELALQAFMVIVLAHWSEHLLQAFQIYLLNWPVPEARGLIGYFYPWVIKSETLHYGYALVMLIGLWLLRPGFTGKEDRRWWDVALAIQFFHHFEHLLLITQATTGHYIAGRPVPTSLIQLWVPRVELHLFYNTIVFVPMVVAMYYHMFPTGNDAAGQHCTCSWQSRTSTAGA
jgi:hypothetical protein